MGYGVAMTARGCAEERETLSLGLAHGHSLWAIVSMLRRVKRKLKGPRFWALFALRWFGLALG